MNFILRIDISEGLEVSSLESDIIKEEKTLSKLPLINSPFWCQKISENSILVNLLNNNFEMSLQNSTQRLEYNGYNIEISVIPVKEN